MTIYKVGYESIDHREIMRVGQDLSDYLIKLAEKYGSTITYLTLGISARKMRKGMINKLQKLQNNEMADLWGSQTDEIIDIIVKEMLEARK